MEDKNNRLKRFQNGSPIEIIETLLNSLDNFMNREIDISAKGECWNLVVIGIHAVALTLSEGLFGKSGITGYKLFLMKFIDIDEKGYDFSVIADDIHNYRNVLAHRWLSQTGYEFGLDFSMKEGYQIRDKITVFNPKRYYQSYNEAFSGGGKIWDYEKILTKDELDQTKDRLIDRYLHKK